MKKVVRFIAQYVDADSGDLIEEAVIKEDVLGKAENLKGLGYTHIEQIDFLQKIQDFKISSFDKILPLTKSRYFK